MRQQKSIIKRGVPIITICIAVYFSYIQAMRKEKKKIRNLKTQKYKMRISSIQLANILEFTLNTAG